jgi:hypothetical protein
METIRKYKWLFIIVLAVSFSAFLFFNQYFSDVKALTDFSASYTKFDQKISDWSESLVGSDLEGALAGDSMEAQVDRAFSELKANAAERISSLIKNDAEFMRIELAISDLSGRERDAIIAYRSAIKNKNADVESLTKQLKDLRTKRADAYARFQQLVQQAK